MFVTIVCPTNCSCYDDQGARSRFVYTECSGLGFNSIPANISDKTTHL